MDSKELRNLHEAYMDVYVPQEVEQLDEISPEIVLAASKAADKKGKRAQASRLYKKFAARDQAANYAGYQRSSVKKEEYDIFDTILEYLVAEGYADTNESALVIMANMSEEWREDILAEAGKNDARIRGNIKSFGSNYTPPRDWDQSANRGQGAVLNAKQKEKQRRKGLVRSAEEN